MTFNLLTNQKKAMEWGLSMRACFGMCKFVDLASWADAVIVDNKTYYVLYRSKLLAEIPIVGKGLNVASKIIKELEDKEIIESVNKSTSPAYRLTDKGREWIGDTVSAPPSEKANVAEPKKFSFRLKSELEFDDLTPQYVGYLKEGCADYAKANGFKASEYDDFINQKRSVGKAHKDWAAAFKTWCSNSNKFSKSSSKQSGSSGGYFGAL